ncbi:MAG: macrolide ABC transporter ATP-binding protein [Elusimicrobia bacterium CG08_land_8_20_14_0_20_51_18]|nr:MAG: macrolide ABC transporter ATP-binding protein [Elusimicrobia bacterium CG08_land_8_20_14_0_20_51_18]
MIKCQNLSKTYPLKKSEGYRALKGLDLKIEKGEFVSICGPSGCGKSTLLNILGFLDIPTGGKYLFKNTDVTSFSDNQRSVLRRQAAGFVFQSFNLLPRLSAQENVKLPMLYLGKNQKEASAKAAELLEKVGLADKRENSILELSGGERQRVGIARALANEPEMLFADEPTGNLDSVNSAEIMKMLAELNKKGGMTVIMVTHDSKLASLTDRIVKIKDGEVAV